jgi:SAM-dependent methyltransferase
MEKDQILKYNRDAWDREVASGNMWTRPVSSAQVQAARRGDWQVVLTPTVPVPRGWFPAELRGADVLCLASGGGQQGPLLAAAGANVTVFDNSPAQLAQDRMVAERDGLAIRTVQGDMADLSVFADESFDLVFNPVSTPFVPDVRAVWRESARVLRRGGALLAGIDQPHVYCLEQRDGQQGEKELVVRHALPYSDLTSIDEETRQRLYGAGRPIEFSHTFSDQLGGMLAAGLHITGLFEDVDPGDLISRFMPTFMAIRAIKP